MLTLCEHVRFWLVPPPWLLLEKFQNPRCRGRRTAQVLQVGDIRLHVGKIGGLFILLALTRPGSIIRTREIIEALWPDADDEPADPSNDIHVSLLKTKARLRKVDLHLDVVGLLCMGGYRINGLRELEPCADDQNSAIGKRSLTVSNSTPLWKPGAMAN